MEKNKNEAELTELMVRLLVKIERLEKDVKECQNSHASAGRLRNFTGYLFIEDLSLLFRMHRNTIYRYMNDGLLPHTRIGRQIVFLEKDIHNVLMSNYTGIGKGPSNQANRP